MILPDKMNGYIERFRSAIHGWPRSFHLLKWGFLGWAVISTFIIFIMQPIYINKIWVDRNIVPINESFYVLTETYKSFISEKICIATRAHLNMTVLTKRGYYITLDPAPEPFGYDDRRVVVASHGIPEVVNVGETLIIRKIVTYNCKIFMIFNLEKTVSSAETQFTVGPPAEIPQTPDLGANRKPRKLLILPVR